MTQKQAGTTLELREEGMFNITLLLGIMTDMIMLAEPV